MKLCSYLSTSRHGIYYFRYPVLNLTNGNRNSIRLSLKTRCPNAAKLYAIQLRAYCIVLKDNNILSDMKTDEIRLLISEYLDDIYRRSIETINENDFSADVRKSYKDAIKYLRADIKANNREPLDIYTPTDDFKRHSGLSSKDFQHHSNEIMPMLRQGCLDHYSKLIEYGDAKNQANVERLVSPQNASSIATCPP